MRWLVGLTIALATLAGSQSPARAPRQVTIPGAGWPDKCISQPGYEAFREQLSQVVQRRDHAGLKSMIGSRGAIRLRGLQLGSSADQWRGLDADAFWNELSQLLELGCTTHKGRLLFPYVAEFAHGGDITEDHVIAMRGTLVRSSADASSRVLRKAPRGSVLDQLGPDESGRWMRVILPREQIGFVPIGDVRSAYGTVIEADREGGAWRIVWIGGYD